MRYVTFLRYIYLKSKNLVFLTTHKTCLNPHIKKLHRRAIDNMVLYHLFFVSSFYDAFELS